MMKSIFLCISLLFVVYSSGLSAQDTIHFVKSDSVPEFFKIKDDTIVMVNFTLDIDISNIRNQNQLSIEPVISSGDTVHVMSLPPVVINGTTRALMDKRNSIRQKPDTSRLAPYAVYSVKEDSSSSVVYKKEIAYQPWMEDANLKIVEKMTGCNCIIKGNGDSVFMERILYAPDYNLGEMQPCPVEYTIREEQRDAFIIYEVNKYDLRPDMYGNISELQKIEQALNFVRTNPYYKIKNIEITGYASPEAPLEYNITLAERRAEALKQYIEAHYTLPDSILKVMPCSENWDGLVAFLKDFQIGHKDEIFRIIEEESDLDIREAKIRKVGGGIPYKMIYGVIYPNLRKNTFTINYISQGRSIEEADSLVFANPSELNPYEFYAVADSLYLTDSVKYAEVLMIAADTYPEHAIANSNAALVALDAGKEELAEKYLDKVGNEPFTWNIRGVMHARRGEAKDAVFWWQKGVEEGDEACINNMNELKKRIYNP